MDCSGTEGAVNIPNYRAIGKSKFEWKNHSFCWIWKLATKDTVSCCGDDIFTSTIRSEASHAFASTLPLRLIVSPTVVWRYHRMCPQQGVNASSASWFNAFPKLQIAHPPVVNTQEDGAHDATSPRHAHSLQMQHITSSKTGCGGCGYAQPH